MPTPRPSPRTGRRRAHSTGSGGRVGAESVPLKPADVRALGRALDGLVRSIRMQGAGHSGAAERTHASWHALSLAPMEVQPTRLVVGGRVALDNGEQEVRWLLPAFMAGLRMITPRAEMSADDLHVLGVALAQVESVVASIEGLRDWLWSGAATGFDIELQHSFMEALDDALVDAPTQGGIYEPEQAVSAVRTEVMRSLSEQAVAISVRVLAEAAARDEFDMPLGIAPPRVNAAAFALSATEASAARMIAEDASRWSLDETLLLLAYRPLHELSRPDRVARVITGLVEANAHGAAAALIDALTALARRSDPFGRDLLRVLDRASFGESLVRALADDVAHVPRLAEAALHAGPEVSTRVAHALLESGARDGACFEALGAAISASGGRLAPLLMERVEAPNAAQVQALVRLFGDEAIDAMFARAREDGERWVGLSLGALCRAAIERGRGVELVVAFVRDRSVSALARVEALDIAQEDPALATETLAWRAAELLDPPALREKLRALREQRRGAR